MAMVHPMRCPLSQKTAPVTVASMSGAMSQRGAAGFRRPLQGRDQRFELQHAVSGSPAAVARDMAVPSTKHPCEGAWAASVLETGRT